MPQVTMQNRHAQAVNRSQRRLLSLAVSATLAAGASAGVQAQVFPPAIQLSSLDGTNGFKLDGEAAGDYSGYAVSAAGDVNGDGFDDLLIGADRADPNGSLSGSSYVVFGKSTGFPSALNLASLTGTDGFRLDGIAANDRSGFAVSAAGDVNGDGFDDLLIGSPVADPNGSLSGSSYVVFGKSAGFPAALNLASLTGTDGFRLDGAANDRSGRAVSAAGDVNGDGFDDLLIGAFVADPNGIASGSSYVVFGKSTGFPAALNLASLTGTDGFRLDGVAAYDFSGYAVSAGGDVNGDGFDDLLIGAPRADPNGSYSGSSYVVFGKNAGFPAALNLASLTGTDGFRLDGVAAEDFSGRAVSAAGDINGDGFDDLLIGANGADPNGSGSGSSYVVFGKSTGFAATLALASLNGTEGFRLDGAAAYDASGRAVSAAGDVNGDGFDDLLIGAFGADPNGSGSGSSYVVFGKTTGFSSPLPLSSLDGSNGFKLDGETTGDLSGVSVSATGDANGDGFDDLLIGAYRADPNGSYSGSSYVVFGGSSGPGLVPAVGITPASLSFGDIELGVQSIETLTLENIGTGTLAPGMLTLSGPKAGEFNIEVNNCAGAQLAPGDTCVIDVGFTPPDPGIRSATLLLESNAPTSPDLVALVGTNDVLFFDGFEDR